MQGIIRNPTNAELAKTEDSAIGEDSGFIPIQTKKGKFLTNTDKLFAKLAEEQQKTQAKGLPFAWAAAKAEIDDASEQQRKILKRQGHLKGWEVPKIDWNKYSDLKNFELIDSGESHDAELSKLHHMPIFIAFKKYQFTGFSNTYKICEGIDSAIERSRKKHIPSIVKVK